MKMKLYTSATSPFARKVRVAIEELALASLVEEIPTDYLNPTADFLAANPLAQIPTLVTEKGETLPNSDLIIEYLQTRSRSLTSLPRGSQRWAALRRAALAEGILEAAVSSVMESRRPAVARHQPWLDRKLDAIRRSLEQIAADADKLVADAPTMVEISVAVMLGYIDLRLPQLDWRAQHEVLAQWYAVFSERPSMLKTAPPTA